MASDGARGGTVGNHNEGINDEGINDEEGRGNSDEGHTDEGHNDEGHTNSEEGLNNANNLAVNNNDLSSAAGAAAYFQSMPAHLGPLSFLMPQFMDVVVGAEEQEGMLAMRSQQFPSAVRCPTCQFSHAYTPYDPKGKPSTLLPQHSFSHNARILFQAGACPVCLEDEAHPMVTMNCGHWICVQDFLRIGGKTGENARKSVAETRREEIAALRENMQEENQVPDEALAVLMQMLQAGTESDEDYDEYDDEFDAEQDDDYGLDTTDDEMPALVDRRAVRNIAAGDTNVNNVAGGNNPEGGAEQDDSSWSSSLDDLPDLIPRRLREDENTSSSGESLPPPRERDPFFSDSGGESDDELPELRA